jgi:mannosyltransferase
MATDGARGRWLGVSGLLLLSTVLRLHRLGSQLWLDEIDAVLESIRRPAAEIVTRWPASTSHVLYDLCAHGLVRGLGESALVVRLPAALFGVAGVGALYAFADAALGHRVALAAGALLAVSYHDVFYSQNARGYTTLLFFALLASWAILRLRSAGAGRGVRLGYALSGALAAYAVVLGLFVVAGHALLLGAGVGVGAIRRRTSGLDLRPYAASVAMATVLIAVLYAPFARPLLRFAVHQAQVPADAPAAASDPSAARTGRLARLGVAADAVEGLARGFGGAGALAAVALVSAIGAAAWARRDALSLAVLVAPVGLELAALLAADVPLSPRYFALALPPLVLALGAGLVTVADRVTRAWPPVPSRWAADALIATSVLAAALPLATYYRVPKQDFLGAMAGVASRAREGDGKIAVHYAARGLCRYYHAGFQDVQALADLESQERMGRRLLLVTTLERFLAAEAPALHAHIQSSYRRVQVLPATVGGAEMNIYERTQARF